MCVCVCVLHSTSQGLEPDEFWKFLGGEPEDPIPVSPVPIPFQKILFDS